LTYLVTLVAGE